MILLTYVSSLSTVQGQSTRAIGNSRPVGLAGGFARALPDRVHFLRHTVPSANLAAIGFEIREVPLLQADGADFMVQ